ncbi:MAG TPA: SRPBCC family protein [Candidatus Limnocylindria bacterium]|nr:SRPBCC family protein [Candidatus Limnocylindria bacterium]
MAKWTIGSSATVPVPPETIYAFYKDPSTWGSWGHNTRWGRARGPVVEGSVVDVRAGYGKVYPVLMRRMVENRYVECEIRPPGMLVETTFSVEPTDGGSRVEHTISVSGAFSGITKLIRLDRLYRRLLDREIAKLAALAQRGRPSATG